jgi:hypothetical protein
MAKEMLFDYTKQVVGSEAQRLRERSAELERKAAAVDEAHDAAVAHQVREVAGWLSELAETLEYRLDKPLVTFEPIGSPRRRI